MNDMVHKRSLIDRILGTPHDDDDLGYDEMPASRYHEDESDHSYEPEAREIPPETRSRASMYEGATQGGHMPEGSRIYIDLFETQDSIVIKTLVPGVRPENVDINISRDAIVISGKRADEHSASQDNYHVQELYWGEFQRTIPLPDEIDIDNAQANSSNGLLTITLPKVDKHREAKLKIKTKVSTS